MFIKSEIEHIRKLCLKLRGISENPIYSENIERWRRHTSLGGEKPMIFVHPDGAWSELLPETALTCNNSALRALEYQLMQKLLRAKYIHDDVPIIGELVLKKVIHNSMWGIQPEIIKGNEARGSYKHKPIIEKASDWDLLKPPVVTYDEEATEKLFREVCECFGDILPVRLVGITNFSFHLMHWYCDYRGLSNMLTDLIDDPEMVHYAIQFFTAGVHTMLDQIEAQGLVSKNNDDSFHYTGGIGYTNDLPEEKDRWLLSDVWGAAEAQEFSEVSPGMHEEFILHYERTILERFGLNGYGCCDNLSKKLPGVLQIKNLRRVAVCPWADIAEFTPVLKKDYIMTWKPLPTHLAYERFDGQAVYNEISAGLEKARGGIIELILRDTHTCKNQPERFNLWIDEARLAIKNCWE